jgi:protoporphyrinogen oxidase
LKIGIIGAGATGLTAGYELSKKGHVVSIFEKSNTIGGLADTVNVGGQQLEKFYHHIFTSDNYIIKLLKELDLDIYLKWENPLNGIYINNRFYPMTSPADLLVRFKELSFYDRLRMGLMVYKARFIKDWSKLENITSKEWIINNAGSDVYEKVWGPLLKSKFDNDADKISGTWIWNKFKLRGSTRGKNVNKELLGYVNGSFGIMFKKLAERIKSMGGSIECSRKATGVRNGENGTLDIVFTDGLKNFDSIIVTTSPEIFAKMDTPLPDDYKKRLKGIKYRSNICLMLELDVKLSPYYWITVAQEEMPFVLVIEHTNLISDGRYGSNIVYLSRYLDENNELYTLQDSEIETIFFKSLKKMFPLWNEENIKEKRLYRARYAQPVVVKGYSKKIPDYKTPVKNLYIASMSQIYPEDRGQNYAIKIGKDIVQMINFP